MSKGLKISLYVLLILAVIAVVWLMLGNSKPVIESPEDIQISVEESTEQNTENIQEVQPQIETFEEDIMRDLEEFFGNSNGYEDIQGDFGFTNPEN